MKLIRWAAVVVGLTLVSVVRADSTIVTFESAGGNAAAIMATRDAFGVAIGGGAVAGANGSFGGVRRKINWDGVPDAQADPNSFSANFFNVISPPGVVFGTPGSGFLASANAGQSASVLFGFANDFQVFSPQRPFTAVNSNVTHVRLFVPDTAMATTTTASGLAFVDVEVAGSTRLQFFDANNVQMYSPDALVAGNHGLTVLGGRRQRRDRSRSDHFRRQHHRRQRRARRPNDDIVVMDAILYAEPLQAVPEPSTFALPGLGLLAALAARRRRSVERARVERRR